MLVFADSSLFFLWIYPFAPETTRLEKVWIEICRFGETRAYLIGIYRFGEIWANLVWKLCRPKERKKRVGEIK